MKHNVLFLTVLTNFLFNLMPAQAPNWVKGVSGPDDELARHSSIDTSGNTYVVGTFTGSLTFHDGSGDVTLTSLGEKDIYFASYSTGGGLRWVKQLGGSADESASMMHVDPSGNVLLTGSFSDSLYPQLPAKTNALAAGTASYGFVAKFSSMGNLIWARQFAGNSVRAHDVTADINGCYITGDFRVSVDLDPGTAVTTHTSKGQTDIFVCHLDNLGNYVWSQTLGGTGHDEGDCIAAYGAFIYIAGVFDHFMDFDPGPGFNEWYSKGGRDIFLLKLTTQNGMYMEHGIVGGANTPEHVIDMTTSSQQILFAGFFGETCDFDPQTGEVLRTFEGGQDIFVLKTDLNLNYEWVKLFSGPANEYVRSIITDSQDNVYIAGHYEVTMDFDPSEYVVMGPSLGMLDYFYIKMGAGGQHLCSRVGGGKGSDGIVGIGLHDGTLYMHGFYGDDFTGDTDFDRGEGQMMLSSSNDGELFTMSWDACAETVGLTEYGVSGIQLYPNPGKGLVTLRGLQLPATIQVFDGRGTLVRTIQVSTEGPVDLRELASGLYSLKGIHDGSVQMGRLLIE